jgi:hypothetical protein
MLGFCADEVNPFGPVQLYVAPATAGVVRLSVDPTHTGLLLEAVGVGGGVPVIVWLVVLLQPNASVTVSEIT